MRFDPAQLPQVAEWCRSFEPGPLGLTDYVRAQVGPTAAVAVAGLLWPRLIRVQDCILLADRYDAATFEAWRARLGPRRAAIEAVVNHVHLWDVFGDGSDTVPTEALGFFGSLMARTWELAGAEAFPRERMAATFADNPDEHGPTVTLCCVD